MFTLKIMSSKQPPHILSKVVGPDSTIMDLKQAIFSVLPIEPQHQNLLVGFPQKRVQSGNEEQLSKSGIRNGDVVVVEELKASNPLVENGNVSGPRGELCKQVVPSDNSCLFSSIHYLFNGGDMNFNRTWELRKVVASAIKKDPERYNEAILEKPVDVYCQWIMQDTTWGGGIELSILNQHFRAEIVVIDAPRGTITRFGEDKNYSTRVFVLYDGIHYDPVHLATENFGIEYVVPSSALWLLEQASCMALQEKQKKRYTDTDKFDVQCGQCGAVLKGDAEVSKHAKATGHGQFQEVNKNNTNC